MVQVRSNTPIVLRVKFFKKGDLQYVSHLDLVRTMMKVIVRADLPLWYTEGFNPKPKLTFAAPLSIGTESVCEFMDIRLTEKMDPALALAALNRNMAGDMQGVEAYYPDAKLTDLAWLFYRIEIDSAEDAECVAERCRFVLSRPELKVIKKGKSGESEVDIKPLIQSAEVSVKAGKVVIDAYLSADQSKFLNPEYVVKVLKAEAGILSSADITKESYTILRLAAYRADMSEFR